MARQQDAQNVVISLLSSDEEEEGEEEQAPPSAPTTRKSRPCLPPTTLSCSSLVDNNNSTNNSHKGTQSNPQSSESSSLTARIPSNSSVKGGKSDELKGRPSSNGTSSTATDGGRDADTNRRQLKQQVLVPAHANGNLKRHSLTSEILSRDDNKSNKRSRSSLPEQRDGRSQQQQQQQHKGGRIDDNRNSKNSIEEERLKKPQQQKQEQISRKRERGEDLSHQDSNSCNVDDIHFKIPKRDSSKTRDVLQVKNHPTSDRNNETISDKKMQSQKLSTSSSSSKSLSECHQNNHNDSLHSSNRVGDEQNQNQQQANSSSSTVTPAEQQQQQSVEPMKASDSNNTDNNHNNKTHSSNESHQLNAATKASTTAATSLDEDGEQYHGDTSSHHNGRSTTSDKKPESKSESAVSSSSSHQEHPKTAANGCTSRTTHDAMTTSTAADANADIDTAGAPSVTADEVTAAVVDQSASIPCNSHPQKKLQHSLFALSSPDESALASANPDPSSSIPSEGNNKSIPATTSNVDNVTTDSTSSNLNNNNNPVSTTRSQGGASDKSGDGNNSNDAAGPPPPPPAAEDTMQSLSKSNSAKPRPPTTPVTLPLTRRRHSLASNAPSDSISTVMEDPLFRTDKVLSSIEMELLWLGEESMYALFSPHFEFDFIWEYASEGLRVELRKVQRGDTSHSNTVSTGGEEDDDEDSWYEQILRPHWLVMRRFQAMREKVRFSLRRGERRELMTYVIADLRLRQRDMTARQRKFPPHQPTPTKTTNTSPPLWRGESTGSNTGRPVEAIDPETLEVVRVFTSMTNAESQIGVPRKQIRRVLLRQGEPTAGGYFWRYVGETHKPWAVTTDDSAKEKQP